jgi:predicted glutamine amidotransferase
MCELLCIHTGNLSINQVYLSLGLQIDSKYNFHGTGFASVDDGDVRIYKTAVSADQISDLGIDIAEFVTGNLPIIGHVRAASRGMNVTDANAHPFQGERFTLAHNGRLYKKDEVVAYSAGAVADNTSMATDSEEFLAELEKYAKANPGKPFLDLITHVMGEHKGKFALMIFDSKTKDWYVCRGTTAELHFSTIYEYPMAGGKGTSLGFIVNTKKESLREILLLGTPVAQLASGKRLGYTEPLELKKDTIYRVKGKLLVELGSMPENSTYTAPVIVAPVQNTDVVAASAENLAIEVWRYCDRIYRYMIGNFLTITDIDTLLLMFCGVPMANAGIEDLDIFVNIAIPQMSASGKLKKLLNKDGLTSFTVYPYMYRQVPSLSYPWMLSSIDAIHALAVFIENKSKG